MGTHPEKTGTQTRRLSAIMFTDIVGYTALMQRDEKTAAEVRAFHREQFELLHTKHNGNILQYFGDGTLSVFKSGVEAVECALAIQQACTQVKDIPLRVGLHIGDIVFDGTEIYGDGVNLASRIENLGLAGSILISAKLNDELKNQNHLQTQSIGHFSLKNVNESIEIFSLIGDGIKVVHPGEIEKGGKKVDKTIAVLPLVNMSSDPENEYFSDGMTEEIINALAKISGLKVTSRTSSFFFKNKNIPVPQIGRELNVSTILEGSVRLSGKKMRITAQLIDVADDFHFWSETFDRSIEDVFAVQDEISILIADKLREHIGHFDLDDHLVDRPEIPVEVYKTYLKGRFHLMKLTIEGTKKGIEIFKEVIAAQPDFPLPYLDINQGYTYLGTMGLIPAHEGFSKGKPYLDQALKLDANLAQSQLNLAWINCWQNWDLEATYKHLNRALEIQPSDEIYLTYANILGVEGKFEASHNYIDKALQVAPFSAMNHHFKGFLYYLQEDFEKAFACFDKALGLKPDLPFPHIYRGLGLVMMGKAKEGLAFFENLTESGDLTKLGGMTYTYCALGEVDKAQKGMQELEAALQSMVMDKAMIFLIFCHVCLGQQEAAIQYLEMGFNNHLPQMLLFYTEPVLKPLRNHPRFQELMRGALGESTSFDATRRKYKKALYNNEDLEENQRRLEQLMQEEKPYLDPNLSLRKLAELMGSPANYLSQLLNEGFDKNFAEYVNSYRLEAFKAKVADPAQRHLTILALAFDSGFNSKTVFNTFFKKMTGLTPRRYWKSVGNELN